MQLQNLNKKAFNISVNSIKRSKFYLMSKELLILSIEPIFADYSIRIILLNQKSPIIKIRIKIIKL
ncbi:hypothetical protein BpHYR1_008547 [Brachionus plicatilis]|uniref:Uncharacterized protein n=1 Tax=Brachionus plicatilis TaxID=10195 RepID=A0A3M7T4R7_BRAPC|nr:hypothetical protein BpHYR1_008547 [Brachionus plicatilis]